MIMVSDINVAHQLAQAIIEHHHPKITLRNGRTVWWGSRLHIEDLKRMRDMKPGNNILTLIAAELITHFEQREQPTDFVVLPETRQDTNKRHLSSVKNP